MKGLAGCPGGFDTAAYGGRSIHPIIYYIHILIGRHDSNVQHNWLLANASLHKIYDYYISLAPFCSHSVLVSSHWSMFDLDMNGCSVWRKLHCHRDTLCCRFIQLIINWNPFPPITRTTNDAGQVSRYFTLTIWDCSFRKVFSTSLFKQANY